MSPGFYSSTPHPGDVHEDDHEAVFGPPMTPEEKAYWAELEAEQKRLDAIPRARGHRAVAESGECEGCGTENVVLYEQVAYTIGWAGHPGAEQTAFQVCEPCLTR